MKTTIDVKAIYLVVLSVVYSVSAIFVYKIFLRFFLISLDGGPLEYFILSGFLGIILYILLYFSVACLYLAVPNSTYSTCPCSSH